MTEQLSNRPPCSLPMADADPRLGNFNWTKGLQSETDWIWSGNLTRSAFPNNLARFFLHIPAVFEQQLNYSTTLIFDEPSYRNGVQMSGFIPRVTRELVISFIAQLRRSHYSMTHHTILGTLTARKYKLSDTEISDKWGHLLEWEKYPNFYTRTEMAALKFARAFATDPKCYLDSHYAELRSALTEENAKLYWAEIGWLKEVQTARTGLALAIASGKNAEEAQSAARAAVRDLSHAISTDDNERKVNAQVVELGFICLQFVALTGVFSALNIPDEASTRETFEEVVPEALRVVIDRILAGTTDGMPPFIPPRVELPSKEIASGQVRVQPSLPRGRRIPLVSWESEPSQGTRDKGLALGGIQVGVYGWSFGAYFPGSLPYSLMHHGELARFEAPYSLPLLFNEDEWRNGTQTGGYNRPPIKELVIQKVYHLTRSRYGLEHHSMFFFNAFLQSRGVGAFRIPGLTDAQHTVALAAAIGAAEAMLLNVDHHREAPAGIFSAVELGILDWVEAFVMAPHTAYRFEPHLRSALMDSNQLELSTGIRRLDVSGLDDPSAAAGRLVDHQVAELSMIAGHMDGLGRFLSVLQLESELPVDIVRPSVGTNNILELQLTGAMNSRPGLFDALRFCFVPTSVLTVNELLANPTLNMHVRDILGHNPQAVVALDSAAALLTAEF